MYVDIVISNVFNFNKHFFFSFFFHKDTFHSSPICTARHTFSTPHAFHPSFTLRTISLLHLPSAVTCDLKSIKQYTSSSGWPFSLTPI